MKRLILASMLALYAAACGGNAETAEQCEHSEGGEHGEHHDEHHGEHGEHHGEHGEHEGHGEHRNVPETLEAFHGAFHPVWHGEESERVTAGCAEAENFVTLAEANNTWAASATELPEGFAAAAADLVTKTTALQEQCAAGTATAENVSDVHDPLHTMMHSLH